MIGTLNPETDYKELASHINWIKRLCIDLQSKGCRIEVPVEQRWWEYSSAIMLMDHRHGKSVLNVGGGWDILTPALADIGFHVTECEPDVQCRIYREFTKQQSCGTITILPNTIEALPIDKYDAVFCISVLEHVQHEKEAWANLATRVDDGGILFITTDCMPRVGKGFVFDNLRMTNYTLDVLEQRVNMMAEFGLKPIGKVDYTYHGDQVYDYTFFRAGFIKKG